MKITSLTIPLGIATLTFLLLTFFGGLKHIKLKYHKLTAYITIVLALIHASLVIYLEYFY